MGQTTAELLLTEADKLTEPRVLLVGTGWTPETLAAAAVAIRLKRVRPSVVRLRAIVEGWSYDRIVRELNN